MLHDSHPTKSLNEFIKTIVEIKSKEEEDKLIEAELEKVKKDIVTNLSHSKKMENCIKIIYGDMLG